MARRDSKIELNVENLRVESFRTSVDDVNGRELDNGGGSWGSWCASYCDPYCSPGYSRTAQETDRAADATWS
jgi:hypothetical protein